MTKHAETMEVVNGVRETELTKIQKKNLIVEQEIREYEIGGFWNEH